ncbi:MAG TPA: hydroxymethylbilane synthase [Dehalococcoidia bacterium]|nr:hydroxymethylbilane synthase [Chloroflexota bacterium]HAA95838.1 hydroxymethylbilane synthase [Dehalococcoidia bacterium]
MTPRTAALTSESAYPVAANTGTAPLATPQAAGAGCPRPQGIRRVTSASDSSSNPSGGAIKVGSRGSALALIQDEVVIGRLKANDPELEFAIDTIRTRGDIDQTSRLAGLGLGIFVKELEQELLDGKLDIAVHSLKDMPTLLADGLVLGAVLSREDPRDVLVNRFGCSMEELPEGCKIGTSSPRRAAQLKMYAPHVEIVSIRGNVETRLRKAKGEEADGAILAAAGMVRLGIADQVTEYLSAQQFVPPPGQGILAVEARADDDRMLELLRAIEDADTRFEATAERAFLERIGGGCSVPVGAFARCVEDNMVMTIFMSTEDAEQSFTTKVQGLKRDPLQLANDAFLALSERGGAELLAAARASQS